MHAASARRTRTACVLPSGGGPAASLRTGAGPYQLQAHIAACHATAGTWEQTDWTRIAALYEALEHLTPSPVFTLNRAVAVSMVEGPEAGLLLLESGATATSLRSYHLFSATRADLLRRLGRWREAAGEYERALGLTANRVEQEFLRRRVEECQARLR